MKKSRMDDLSFVRVISTFGIVMAHFLYYLQNIDTTNLLGYKNGSWGSSFVAVFFLLSGAVLYYRYADRRCGITYFGKRWKSIFPMYYLAYLYFEIQNMIAYGSVFFRGNPLRYGFTLLGMDGYLSQNTTTYYILGEWFTGAIIILYLLFPLLLYVFRKNSTLTIIGVTVLFVLCLDVPIINPVSYWSIPSCLMSFAAGMMIMKYKEWFSNRWVVLGCFAIGLLFCFVSLPILTKVGNHVMGVCLFVVLRYVGGYVMQLGVIHRIVTQLSGISYAVFLVHHVMIQKITRVWNPSSWWKATVLLIGGIAIILIMAKVLTLVTQHLLAWISRFKMKKRKAEE